jgi:hypothetical protein
VLAPRYGIAAALLAAMALDVLVYAWLALLLPRQRDGREGE